MKLQRENKGKEKTRISLDTGRKWNNGREYNRYLFFAAVQGFSGLLYSRLIWGIIQTS